MTSGRLQLGKVCIEIGDLVGEFGRQIGRQRIEPFDLIAPHEPITRLGKRVKAPPSPML